MSLDLVDRALLLGRTPLGNVLPDEALLELAELAAVVEVEAGARLDAGPLYVVARGDGPAIAGERGLLGLEDADAGAGEIDAPTRVLVLDRDDVLDALAEHPAMAAALCELVAARSP